MWKCISLVFNHLLKYYQQNVPKVSVVLVTQNGPRDEADLNYMLSSIFYNSASYFINYIYIVAYVKSKSAKICRK